jgi:hypothetical protein
MQHESSQFAAPPPYHQAQQRQHAEQQPHQQLQQAHQMSNFAPTMIMTAPPSQPMYLMPVGFDAYGQQTAPLQPQPGMQMFASPVQQQQQQIFMLNAGAQLVPLQAMQTDSQQIAFMPHGVSGMRTKPAGNRHRFVVPPPAPGDVEPGPRQLIVNYIATDMTNSELRQLFEPYGEVEVARVVDEPGAGHNRGFGFVYMKKSDHAAASIAGLSGRVLRGKRLRVSYAVPQRPFNKLDGTFS